jgi:hypothetical protein
MFNINNFGVAAPDKLQYQILAVEYGIVLRTFNSRLEAENALPRERKLAEGQFEGEITISEVLK